MGCSRTGLGPGKEPEFPRKIVLCPLYKMGNDEQSKQMLDPVNKWIEPLLLIQGVAMKMCYMNTNLTHGTPLSGALLSVPA